MASAETQYDKTAVLAEWEAAQKEFENSLKDEAAIKKKKSAMEKYMSAKRQIGLKELDDARGPSLTKAPENRNLARALERWVRPGEQRVAAAQEAAAAKAAATEAAAAPPEQGPGAARVEAALAAKGIEIKVKSPLVVLSLPNSQ